MRKSRKVNTEFSIMFKARVYTEGQLYGSTQIALRYPYQSTESQSKG